MAAPILTAERLREVLDYNPDTGVFVWKVRTSTRTHVGDVAGSRNSDGYLQIKIDRIRYKCHRLAWLYINGVWPTGEIDHVNCVRDDNRITNLRDVSRNVNMQNQLAAHSNNVSGMLGVCQRKKGWQAELQYNGIRYYLGSYATPEQAHAAYFKAKRRLHSGCAI